MRKIACLLLIATMTQAVASACPFCTAVSQTFSEEIDTMEIAVFARLVHAADPTVFDPETGEMPTSQFVVTEVIKGDKWVKPEQTIDVHFFGTPEEDKQYFMTATENPAVSWGSPVAISDRVVAYIKEALTLPKGYERLTYFLPYLEDDEEILRRDAYDEFAKTPYEGVIALKDSMDREELKRWIQDPDVSVAHRRLYLTMLGVCGQPEDAEFLADIMQADDEDDENRQAKMGLNAMIACYLSLKGESGLPLVTNLYLGNEEARYEDTYAAIMALRFHGNESDKIAREKLLDGMRAVLQRPDLADLVIPDLARWEDWSVIDQLKQLFINADEESNWLRVPVINYLRACPLPEAETAIAELEKVDPEAIKRAAAFFPYSQFSGPDRSESDEPAEPEPNEATKRSPIPAPAAQRVARSTRGSGTYWWSLPIAAAMVMGTILLLGKTTG